MEFISLKNLKSIIGILISVILIVCACLMLKITLPYFSFRYDVDFLLTKQAILHISAWRYAFYIHITTSLFVLIFGGLQFNKSLLINRPGLHRRIGKIYVFLILFLSAPSGLIMAFYANGGIYSKTSFVIISLLWWAFTYRAFAAIRKGKIDLHIGQMIRSYALTLSALTLRTYVVILPYFIHLQAKEMYTLVAWLSWIPNLIIAELVIKKGLISSKH